MDTGTEMKSPTTLIPPTTTNITSTDITSDISANFSTTAGTTTNGAALIENLTHAIGTATSQTVLSSEGTTSDQLSRESHILVIGIVIVGTIVMLLTGYQFFKNRKSLWMPGRGQ